MVAILTVDLRGRSPFGDRSPPNLPTSVGDVNEPSRAGSTSQGQAAVARRPRRLPRKILLLGLLSGACGGTSDLASTTIGLTTVPLTTSSLTGSSSESSTGSSSGSTTSASSGTESASSTLGTSTGSEPDLPGPDTSGPARGCGKIDILFVINDAGGLDWPMAADSYADALSIRSGTAAFIAAMQEQAAGYDLHVMAVKGDPAWRGANGVSDCCDGENLCDKYGPFPCDLYADFVTECDSALGAGVRYPAGFMASNRDCELANHRRYITAEQPDFAAAAECILNVGQTGGEQKYLSAMSQAIGPALNAPDSCNAGFLRPDAMLVVVVLADEPDDASPGTPEGLAASLIAAKGGYTDGIVVVGILGSVQSTPPDANCYDGPEERTREFVEGFPNHVLGSFCAEYIGANLVAALDVIQAACGEFVPPG